ncbi:hypothetical protein [Flavobacterium sp.]|uniref:hypothetical protein n=1 Tax=Flavobacterium sp. TaxID=239 RepID=UPI002602A187|nr:hypothetical protein [Flavobacterium sp.]
MKTIKFSIIWKQLLLVFSIGLLIFSSTSCAKKTVFNTSPILPAARGEITIKKDRNSNYNIELQISYLAEPNRLNPPKLTYVVWMLSEDSNPINLGQIISTTKLHVKFETVSSSKPKMIFITGEDDPSVLYPSNVRVLETNKF